MQLLERHRGGETASELAECEGIPIDRILVRLDAAMRLERIRSAETNAYPGRLAA